MTNEEIIDKLAFKELPKEEHYNDFFKCNLDYNAHERSFFIEGATQMAEWKDKQFNMIMEKTIELFDKYPSNAVFSKNNVVEMFKTLKKAMEE